MLQNISVWFYCTLLGSLLLRQKPTFPDLYEASLVELSDGLASGQFTSVDLVKVRLHLTFAVQGS